MTIDKLRAVASLGLLSATGIVLAQDAGTSPVPPADPNVGVTIVLGQPTEGPLPKGAPLVPGDISINLPSADVAVAAQAVLHDILQLPYAIEPETKGPVRVVTPRPIARQSVLQFFEEALRLSGFALVDQNGSFLITPLASARIVAPVDGESVGFSNEVITLKFVSADQMKALLDPILPGLVTATDPVRNTLTLAGTSGQRTSARELLAQFDVNWLRAMSFGLYTPQRTDSRLITPELERLLNAPDAPTRGLVRLIAMEKLNGILAVSSQPQYLDDVRRWIEILDREGQNNEPQLFVYRVQNGRSRDLSRTINAAFGNRAGGGDTGDVSALGGAPDGQPADNDQQSPDQGNRLPGRQPASNRQGGSFGNQAEQDAGAEPDFGVGNRGRIRAIITSDDNNNAVIVFGTPREYAVIEAALRQLDVLPVQVLIEAAITEVSLNEDLRYGLQWNFTSGDTNTVLTESATGTNLVRAVPGFSFLFANNNNISAVLNTLESKTRVNVVSAPKLLVLNNQTAALQVGDQVPVLTQSSTSTIDANAPVINAIEYRDTGVILKVTPRVNATGLVLLDIAQEVSDVSATRASGTGVNSPTISTRRITTSVAVNDGEVLALGGLIRNTQSRDKIGLPILSQIPIIGGIFGRQAKLEDRIELIVLLKPRVIRSVNDGRAITDELRRKIRTLEPFRSTGQIP